jgi:hypothetical protein
MVLLERLPSVVTTLGTGVGWARDGVCSIVNSSSSTDWADYACCREGVFGANGLYPPHIRVVDLTALLYVLCHCCVFPLHAACVW